MLEEREEKVQRGEKQRMLKLEGGKIEFNRGCEDEGKDSCDYRVLLVSFSQPLLPRVLLETGHYDTTRLSSLLCTSCF